LSTRRLAMVLRLRRQPDTRAFPCRTVTHQDRESLAILLYAAFRDSVDDEGETPADARAEIDRLFSGAFGRFLPECSFLIEADEQIVSACLVTWFEHHEAPLVAFSMTRPEYRKQGMARFLLQQAMNALIQRGESQLTLVVTPENQPARTLYRSLGFSEWRQRT